MKRKNIATVGMIVILSLIVSMAGCGKNGIRLDGIKTLRLNYYEDQGREVKCDIDADFDTRTIKITKQRYVRSDNDVSGSDSSSGGGTHEETQVFTDLNMAELNSFLVKNGVSFLDTDEYAYDLTDGKSQAICSVTIHNTGGQYYHKDMITRYPDHWDEFLALIKKTTGSQHI
ncbi:MAG: hypothetical protein IKX58_02505 [Clostridia bacterium]|nr:hypothetical protein [Clostridia bacterium]